jgi:polyhydroxyalkanoate synthesis regulator phasin
VADRPDIPDALREAVERTVRATVDTRERAQDAVDDLAGTVEDLRKEAERNISRSRRSVRAAVGERLPATQEDVKALRTELRRIVKRLEAIEKKLS